VLLIALLTWTNTRGLEYGRIVQHVFTIAKTGAVVGLVAVGLVLGWNSGNSFRLSHVDHVAWADHRAAGTSRVFGVAAPQGMAFSTPTGRI
jgi:amino acid transporter